MELSKWNVPLHNVLILWKSFQYTDINSISVVSLISIFIFKFKPLNMNREFKHFSDICFEKGYLYLGHCNHCGFFINWVNDVLENSQQSPLLGFSTQHQFLRLEAQQIIFLANPSLLGLCLKVILGQFLEVCKGQRTSYRRTKKRPSTAFLRKATRCTLTAFGTKKSAS